MTTTQKQTQGVDVTLMYLTHDAFRRDLARLGRAAEEGRLTEPSVRAGWANFVAQLDVHHTVEDAALWPQVAAATSDDPDAAAVLADMEAEHGRLDALLAAVGEAVEGRPVDAVTRVEELAAALAGHMRHEETAALPLIQRVLTPKEWDGFRRAMARRQGPKGAAAYVPWMVDGATDGQRRDFLAHMPKPVGVLNRLLWEPRYAKRRNWV